MLAISRADSRGIGFFVFISYHLPSHGQPVDVYRLSIPQEYFVTMQLKAEVKERVMQPVCDPVYA